MILPARGGTTLTVAGEDLDVVADPILEVTMVHTFPDANGALKENISFYSSVSSDIGEQ